MKTILTVALFGLVSVTTFAKPRAETPDEINYRIRHQSLTQGRYGVTICAPYSIPAYESGGPFRGNCPAHARRR